MDGVAAFVDNLQNLVEAHLARIQPRASAQRSEAASLNRKNDCFEDRRVFIVERTVDEDVPRVLGVPSAPHSDPTFAPREPPRQRREFVPLPTCSFRAERECPDHRGSTPDEELSRSFRELPECQAAPQTCTVFPVLALSVSRAYRAERQPRFGSV